MNLTCSVSNIVDKVPCQSQEVRIVFMRHGRSDHNGDDGNYWYNSNPEHPNYRISNLTEEGKEVVCETAMQLAEAGVCPENSIAFVSPLPRTRQTAAILAKNGIIGQAIVESAIVEVQAGDLESKSGKLDDQGQVFSHAGKRIAKKAAGYESHESIAHRVHEFAIGKLSHVFQEHTRKEEIQYIVIISHDEILKYLIAELNITDPSKEMIAPGKYRIFSVILPEKLSTN